LIWIVYDLKYDYDGIPELVVYAIFLNAKEAEELSELMYQAAFDYDEKFHPHCLGKAIELKEKYDGRLEPSSSVKVIEVEVEASGINRDHGWVHK